MIKHILVPIDSSEHSGRVVAFATELAVKLDASITFLHVLTRVLARESLKRYVASLEAAPNPDLAEIGTVQKALSRSGEDEGTELLTKGRLAAEKLGIRDVTTLLRDGDPASVIVHEAESGMYDLVILGRRGLGGLRGLVMGSVSHKVSATAECTVVIVT